MFFTQTTVRSTFSVCAVLLVSIIATGLVSSAYHRERAKLGEQHFRDGQALVASNDLTGGAEEFRKALLFTPDSRQYRLALVTALVNGGKLAEAQSHLEQLLQEDPTNGQLNLLVARIAKQERHDNQAIESYQRAVYEYWPADELWRRRQARWELIQLLAAQGAKRHNDLIGELLQLYGNLPPASAQRLRVGEVLLQNGADAEAASVFRDVLKGSPQDATAHGGLALVAFRSGEYLDARHEYQKALRTAPANGEFEKALQLTNEIVDIAPELPNISATERLRRSTNLLNRVKNDMQRCSGDPAPDSALQQKLQSIDDALKAKGTDADDKAAQMQTMAQDLWSDRSKFCQAGPMKDAAVEAVLGRLSHE